MRSDLAPEQIAERLGYADATNMARAFRRWTGRTPRELRAELRGATVTRGDGLR